jgi:nitroreductase
MSLDPQSLPAPPLEDEKAPPVRASPEMAAVLAQRRSSKPFHLTGPAPDAAQLKAILTLAARVPDHGKLSPWRFLIMQGDARARVGAKACAHLAGDDPQKAGLATQFTRAPLVIVVVSTAAPNAKIPIWEQHLSAGALCYNLLLAAQAFGFGGVWLTGPSAYDPAARAAFALADGEQIAAFVYIGTQSEPAPERARPNISALITQL